ncbi:hypothetical protein GQ600_1731 [Phytophthora cactorum]|nr:hypothetical protein GQ600_1731 [Phytophthora cactorum]
MDDRYFAIYSKLDRVDDELADFIPTPRENVCLKALYEDLKNLESTAMLTLLDVRALFHHVINHYPTTKTHLAASATLVNWKERSLTRAERSAAAKLLQADNSKPTSERVACQEASRKRSFADAALVAEAAPPTQVDLR